MLFILFLHLQVFWHNLSTKSQMNVTKLIIDHGSTLVKIGIIVHSNSLDELFSYIKQNQLLSSKIKLTCKLVLDNGNDCLLLIVKLKNVSQVISFFVSDLIIPDRIVLIGIKTNCIYNALATINKTQPQQVDEMIAICTGVITCIKKSWYNHEKLNEKTILNKKILVASFGTGTSLLVIDERLAISRIGGTCLGAATLCGLKRICGTEIVDDIETCLISEFCYMLALCCMTNNCDL